MSSTLEAGGGRQVRGGVVEAVASAGEAAQQLGEGDLAAPPQVSLIFYGLLDNYMAS